MPEVASLLIKAEKRKVVPGDLPIDVIRQAGGDGYLLAANEIFLTPRPGYPTQGRCLQN